MSNNKYSKNLDDYPDILTPKEVAEILRVRLAAVYPMLYSNQILNFKIGKTYKIPKYKFCLQFDLIPKKTSEEPIDIEHFLKLIAEKKSYLDRIESQLTHLWEQKTELLLEIKELENKLKS